MAWVITEAALLGFAATSGAQPITVTPDKPDGVYNVGDTVHFLIQKHDTDVGQITDLQFRLKQNGLTSFMSGSLLASALPTTLTTQPTEPGAILAEVTGKIGDKEFRALGGAAISPDKITPSSPRPADFDDFWAAKIKELAAVPTNPQLEPGDSGDPAVDYFKIRMDNINGSHIYGQLARPHAAGKLPALLIVQWAGVYGLHKDWAVPRAKPGWLVLNIEPHDLPFDQPDDFYKHAAATTLHNYWTFNSGDRDKSYFLRMYLSCYRAAEYLTQRDDWDGKTLVVMGTSQGGQQTFVTAALHPKITAMMACVPSSCDVTGPSNGRAIGYPNWADQAKEKNDPKILETGRYFDPVNFAPRIHCPALVALGLIDEVCPPTDVLAACNQLQCPKQILILVNSNHGGDHNAQKPYNDMNQQWLDAIREGKTVPLMQ